MAEAPTLAIPPAERTDALQVLLESSAMLLATSSQQEVLSGILRIAGRVLAADAFAVWRECDGHGTWRAVATRGLSPGYRTQVRGTEDAAPRKIQVIPDVLAAPWLEQFREVYIAENIRGMLVAPLSLHDGRGGTLTFYWHTVHPLDQTDLDYAEALANLAAAALNQNELHLQNQREKQRLAFLAEASAVLASSLEYETTLNRVAQLVVPEIADWCIVHIVENGTPTRIVVAHADPAMLASAKEYSIRYPEEIRPDRGVGAVLRTGVSEIYPEITDEMLARAARDPEHLELLRKLGMNSSILVPLTSRGKVLGAIRLLAAGDRYFTTADVQLAEDLAHRAAAAIENAQLHRAVLKKESELRLSHSAAKMGSWSWDLVKGEITWSTEFKLLHGIPADATAGYTGGSELIHPEDRPHVLRQLSETLKSDSGQILAEHRAIKPDGQVIWVQSRGTIHRDADGKATGITGITMDVTESRLSELALRRTEKLAAAGRLAATVAHEVNNPLEALTNLIYLASATADLPEEARTYLATADAELSRIAQIVRQTLGFYRESTRPQALDLGKSVAEVMELYRPRAESRSVKLLESGESGVVMLGNNGEIKQVLANLISNSIDATDAGGFVQASVARQGERIELVIADNGCGISEAHLQRLFEPFFTTKSDVGTGLGLWVSRGIVEKHKGTMRVESRTDPGASGTTVTVSLPALRGEAGPSV